MPSSAWLRSLFKTYNQHNEQPFKKSQKRRKQRSKCATSHARRRYAGQSRFTRAGRNTPSNVRSTTSTRRQSLLACPPAAKSNLSPPSNERKHPPFAPAPVAQSRRPAYRVQPAPSHHHQESPDSPRRCFVDFYNHLSVAAGRGGRWLPVPTAFVPVGGCREMSYRLYQHALNGVCFSRYNFINFRQNYEMRLSQHPRPTRGSVRPTAVTEHQRVWSLPPQSPHLPRRASATVCSPRRQDVTHHEDDVIVLSRSRPTLTRMRETRNTRAKDVYT